MLSCESIRVVSVGLDTIVLFYDNNPATVFTTWTRLMKFFRKDRERQDIKVGRDNQPRQKNEAAAAAPGGRESELTSLFQCFPSADERKHDVTLKQKPIGRKEQTCLI